MTAHFRDFVVGVAAVYSEDLAFAVLRVAGGAQHMAAVARIGAAVADPVPEPEGLVLHTRSPPGRRPAAVHIRARHPATRGSHCPIARCRLGRKRSHSAAGHRSRHSLHVAVPVVHGVRAVLAAGPAGCASPRSIATGATAGSCRTAADAPWLAELSAKATRCDVDREASDYGSR